MFYIGYGRIGVKEHSDSQKSVNNSQPVSGQHSRQKTSKDRSEAKYRRARIECKERL
jgi:hypothetical protein